MSSFEEVVSLHDQRVLRRPAPARPSAVPRSTGHSHYERERNGRPLRPSAAGSTAVRARDRDWPRVAISLVVITAALTIIGLVFILSASSVESISRNGSYMTIFAKQVWWEVLGFAALFVAQRFGIRTVEKWWPLAWISTIGLLIAVSVAGIERNGSKRWISIAGFEVQPSEIAKFAIVAALAHAMSLRRRNDRALASLGRLALFSLPLLGLVAVQPDLGTSIVLAATAVAVLLAGGLRWKYLGFILAGGLVLGSLSIATNDYQKQRVLAFHDISRESAFQVRGSIESIQSGGLSGVGVGAGRSKYGYIPNSHTDFIYSVITEEMGALGATAVLGLFAALAVVGTVIALRAHDAFSRLVAFGITAWISTQALGNVAAVTAMAPVTGIPLPFVSQGGTSFVTLMIATGVLLDIARRGVDPTQADRSERAHQQVHPSQRGGKRS